MQLCFLMERQYAPYAKWFGSAFAQLAIAPQLTPHLTAALQSETWQERDRHFAAIYRLPFTVLPEGLRWRVVCDAIIDERVRRLARRQHQLVGSISQWADSTDVLDAPAWWTRLRRVYLETADMA
jgi:hypothetical protein